MSALESGQHAVARSNPLEQVEHIEQRFHEMRDCIDALYTLVRDAMSNPELIGIDEAAAQAMEDAARCGMNFSCNVLWLRQALDAVAVTSEAAQ